jgi:hypothetical protein
MEVLVMAHFLRDQRIANLSVNEDIIKQISELFSIRLNTLNANIPKDDTTGRQAFLAYIIRFDSKGYRVFTLEDLLRYFHQAKDVERIIFTLETGESLRSMRQTGICMELKLDQVDSGGCFFMVTSNDRDWVESSFSAVQDILAKCKNMNGWVQSAWTQLGVQITGVAFGFFLSLWAAIKVSPKLAIENSFIICFLFVLLIFSNVWSYLNKKVLSVLNRAFPNLKFYRPDKDQGHWLMQAVIGGVVVAIMLWALGLLFSYAGDILSGLITKGKK